MYAIYAFCREVDDIADGREGRSNTQLAALAGWREEIEALYDGPSAAISWLVHCRGGPVRRYGASQRRLLFAILAGMEMDAFAVTSEAPDMATLDLYCAPCRGARSAIFSVHIFAIRRFRAMAGPYAVAVNRSGRAPGS